VAKTFKQRLEEAARGPAVVRSLEQVNVLGVGRAVRRGYDRWYEFQRARWYAAQNREARSAWRASQPGLSPVQQRLVEDLEQSGVARVPLAELLGGDRLWRDLTGAAAAWLASDDVRQREADYRASKAHRGKDYLIRLFGRDAAVEWQSPWLTLAIEPAVLDVVNAYLRLQSKIIYLDLWNTVPLQHDGPDIGSQRWHRDPEDARLIKTFLYLSDVTAGAGPMEYVPRSRHGEQYGDLWPQRFPAGSIPPEDEFNAAIPAADRWLCAYPAGTLLFVDTSGFHRGGRAEHDRRVVATTTYTSHACVWPRAFALDREHVPATLSPAARMALLTPDEPASL
jgi:hypothetical protein